MSPVSIYRSPESYYDPDREVHALVPRQEILANGANLCAGPYLKKDLRYHTGDAELSALLTRRDARAQDIQESDRKIRQLIKNLL